LYRKQWPSPTYWGLTILRAASLAASSPFLELVPMKLIPESYMRELVIRLETVERPDGSVYVTSPTLPLFRIVVPKSEDVLKYSCALLKQHMELNSKKEFDLRPADDVSALSKQEYESPRIPAYIIAEASEAA
jgi:hypothetical protein